MKIIFVCSNYKPAHKYVLHSYSKVFSSCNSNQLYFLSYFTNYPISELPEKCEQIGINEVDKIGKCVVFVISPSKNNFKILRATKNRLQEASFVYLYHEPLTSLKRIFNDHGFSFKSIVYYFGLYVYNGPLFVKKFDYVVLPSYNSKSLFLKRKQFRLKKYFVEYLMFEKKEHDSYERIYFSYIGTIAKNHGFKEFIDFILSDYVSNNEKILIATSSNLNNEIINLLRRKFGDNIVLKYGNFLSDSEIEEAYLSTKVLWLCYTNSAQSGVLPMSLMYGTPPIYSNIEAFNEFLDNNIEGIRIENINDFRAISVALKSIKQNLLDYSNNCLHKFSEKFYVDNQSQKILKDFEIIENNASTSD